MDWQHLAIRILLPCQLRARNVRIDFMPFCGRSVLDALSRLHDGLPIACAAQS